MWSRTLAALLASICLPALASAQHIGATTIRLTTGPCTARAGSGAPNGTVAGSPCDSYQDASTGKHWWKISGAGTTTGWITWDSVNTPTSLMSRDASGDSALRHLTGARIFGNGGTGANELRIGGTGAGCTGWPACEALEYTIDAALITQRMRTDLSRRSQWYVGEDGTTFNSATASDWAPLRLGGGPSLFYGGGVQVGTSTASDPGLGNVAIDGFIGKPGYASQTTGWRIDSLGGADFRYLYTDELHAKAFITDLEQALAGGQIISKSVAVIGAPFTVPAGGSISTLTVKDLPSAADMAVFESGDYVRLRQFSRASGSLSITDAWGTVTGYADQADGLQTWTFTRLVTNGGAMTTGAVIPVDALVLDYGTPGNGFYEVNAIDGVYGVNSPYAQIVTWAGNSPIAANQTVRSRFGNLKGITGNAEYGLLAGTYAASNGRYFIASDRRFELHGIDLKLWNGATNVIRLDQVTPYMSMGSPAPTAFSAGVGCWSGLDAGAFKWRCGDPNGQKIEWHSGTGTLSITGDVVIEGSLPDANNAANLGGVAASVFIAAKDRTNLGLDSAGNPALPAAATPGVAKLYLSSSHLGYYDGTAWKTYMDASGNFYLGGTAGALQWNAGTATLTIAATLSGNGSGITAINGGNITTDTITATQIAANAITTSELAAGAVTAAKITAGTITAAEIAAGAITGDRIAAATITATNLNVANLQAITANTGALTVTGDLTMTAGRIIGAQYEIRQDGLWLDNHSSSNASVNWDGGAMINGGDLRLHLRSPGTTPWSQINLNQSFIGFWAGISAGAQTKFFIDAAGVGTETGASLGQSGYAFQTLWVALGSTTGNHYPVVWDSLSNQVLHKTSVANGAYCGGGVAGVSIDSGLVTGVTCLAPEASQAVRMTALEAELADLRRQLALLGNMR